MATTHSFPELQNFFSAGCIFALLNIPISISETYSIPMKRKCALRLISVTPFYERPSVKKVFFCKRVMPPKSYINFLL